MNPFRNLDLIIRLQKDDLLGEPLAREFLIWWDTTDVIDRVGYYTLPFIMQKWNSDHTVTRSRNWILDRLCTLIEEGWFHYSDSQNAYIRTDKRRAKGLGNEPL